MLVNANCPYSHRDTVWSLSPIYRERREKARILCTTTQGPSTLPLPAQRREQRVFFFPTEHGGVDSILFAETRRDKTNLEQKAVEIFFPPLNSVQGFPKLSWEPWCKGEKETSKTGRLSTRGAGRGEEKKKTATCSQGLEEMRRDRKLSVFL